jgi:hypothetical protein
MYLRGGVYSAVCWRGVELCILVFSINIMYGDEYRILEIKQYLNHLFSLLVRAINTEFFQGC